MWHRHVHSVQGRESGRGRARQNNQGRDVMIDSPSQIDQEQLDELQIALNIKQM